MSFADYRRLAKTRLANRRERLTALAHNPTFRAYCQTHRLNPENRESQERFLRTARGRRLAQKLTLWPDKPAAQVIPHQKARCVGRVLDISPHLRDGHILTLSLDLYLPRSHILAAVSFEVRRYQRHVPDRPKRLSPLAPLPAVLSFESHGPFLQVELDLRTSPDRIRAEVGRLLPARPRGAHKWGRRRRPYPRQISLWDVWEAYDRYKSFRRGGISLGISPDAFRKAYYRAFALITGEAYHPEKHTPAVLPLPPGGCGACPKRPTCQTLCPAALAYVNQDRKGMSARPYDSQVLEKLAATPAIL